MPASDDVSPHHLRLLRKLETISVLGAEERRALAGLPLHVKDVPKNTDIVSEGEAPPDCCLILEGFTCRYKILHGGGRQIFSFHIAGDIPDLQSMHLGVMDHSLGTLTPAKVALIPHSAVLEVIRRYPQIALALWRDTLIDAAVFRAWLAGVGRRTARERIAHLICEVYSRAQAIGLAEAREFEMPVTQQELGDSLGLSSVHVNRVLQDLRREGLIISKGRYLQITDWEGLKRAGDFDPAYLHLIEKADA